MMKISTVWDRTVDVLQGRTGILASIAALTMVAPPLVGAALRAFVSSDAVTVAGVRSLVGFATSLLLLYGILAVTAVASDPRTDRRAAFGVAARRLGVALGILLLLIVVAALLFVPVGVALTLSGVTMGAAGKVDVGVATPGGLALAGALGLLGLVAGLWLSARLVPVFAIVVNERRGLGALRRSLALTRGATMKLIGVLILYAILIIVVMWAATSVVGVVARLALGGEAGGTIFFIVSVISALISAAASVVQSVFYAQFYVAARERDERTARLS